MKLQGKISILINRDYTEIEIEDENANIRFLKVKLTPEQLSMCLSRQASVDCELEVLGVDRLGKKHESKSFEFEIPKELKYSSKSNELQLLAQSQLSGGWIAESYFGSQGSFFSKDGKDYARVTIRRWT